MSFMSFLKPVQTAAAPPRAVGATMADVQVHLAASNLNKVTRADYRRALERCVDFYGAKSLADIPADLRAFKARWRLDGFDPKHFKTEAAYKAWRRKVIAAIKAMTGAFAAKAARVAKIDAWAALIAAIEPHCGVTCRESAMHDSKVLIGVRAVADRGRLDDVTPSTLSAAQIIVWADSADGAGERKTLARAAATLDRLRYLPEVAALLPAEPFGSIAKLRRLDADVVPQAWLDGIDLWVDETTRSDWDPIDESFANEHSGGARGLHRAALRRHIADAIRLAVVDPAACALEDAFVEDVFIAVVRHWRDTVDDATGLKARTAASYVRIVARTLEQRGLEARFMRNALKNNSFLKKGRADDQGMTAATRAFCERVVRKPEVRRQFLTQHLAYQMQAVAILAGRTPAALTGQDRKRFVALGVCAAFAAIELHGTPLRVDNALAIPMRGPGRWLDMPDQDDDAARFLIPKEVVKNGREIPFRMERNTVRALAVLEWYVNVVRPLAPHAATSLHLFPGATATSALGYATFRRWFKKASRALGLPMTPHKFRHGAVSILYDRHPTMIDAIAHYIGDTPETVRRYYAWLDESKSREEIQAIVLQMALEA